jgi:hypothetical protein
LDHRDPVAPIQSPDQKSIASSGHIELCTNLSAEKIDAYIVEALQKEVISTNGDQKGSKRATGNQSLILNFLNEEDALRAYERATGNQSSKNPRSPSGTEIEKLILDQFGKDSTSYRYICLSKKIEGNQGQISRISFFLPFPTVIRDLVYHCRNFCLPTEHSCK